MKMSVAVFVVMAAFVYVKGEAVLHIFTSDPAVIELGLIRIHYVVELEILNICMEVLSGAMRGYGFSLPPAIVTLIGICADYLGIYGFCRQSRIFRSYDDLSYQLGHYDCTVICII